MQLRRAANSAVLGAVVCRVLVPQLNMATSSVNNEEAAFRECFDGITPGKSRDAIQFTA
jgi:hypothetical protein